MMGACAPNASRAGAAGSMPAAPVNKPRRCSIHAVIDLSQSMIITLIRPRERDRHIKPWSLAPRKATDLLDCMMSLPYTAASAKAGRGSAYKTPVTQGRSIPRDLVRTTGLCGSPPSDVLIWRRGWRLVVSSFHRNTRATRLTPLDYASANPPRRLERQPPRGKVAVGRKDELLIGRHSIKTLPSSAALAM